MRYWIDVKLKLWTLDSLFNKFIYCAHPKSTLYLPKNKKKIKNWYIYTTFIYIRYKTKYTKQNYMITIYKRVYVHVRRITRFPRCERTSQDTTRDMEMDTDANIQKRKSRIRRESWRWIRMRIYRSVKSRIYDARLGAIYRHGGRSSEETTVA